MKLGDGEKNMDYEYFRLKVNNGNSYYSIFRDIDFGGLWVGWSSKNNEEVKQKKLENKKLKSNERELMGIIDYLEKKPEIKKRIIIWDRERQEIAFWEITGQSFKDVPDDSLNKISEQQKTRRISKNDSKTLYDHIKGGQIIPCKVIGSIPRSCFPSFIDSLAVYMYLNIGTFRALNNIGDKKSSGLGLFSDRSQNSEFAELVTRYFNWILSKSNDSFAKVNDLTKKQLVKLSLRYMSPAQLETFGSLLLIDLGLTLEIGIGKSLQDVDLRATFIHRSDADERFNRIVSCMQKLGVNLSNAFLKHLQREKTIFIQCKDYDGQNQSEGVLYLCSNNSSNKVDCLSLEYIAENFESLTLDNFPLISDWINRSISFYNWIPFGEK